MKILPYLLLSLVVTLCSAEENERLQGLISGQVTVAKAQDALRVKEKELAAMKARDPAQKPPPDQIIAHEQQLEELRKQVISQETALRSMATGVTGLDGTKLAKDDVDKEVKEVIVRPLLGMAKDLVSRQREISDVKEEIKDRQHLLSKYAQAAENLKTAVDAAKAAKQDELVSFLEKQRKTTASEKAGVELQLGNLQTRLAELDAQKKPLSSYAGALFRQGVVHRVGNLLLAATAFFGVMAFFRLLMGLVKTRFDFERLEARPFAWRLFNVIFYFVSVLIAAAAALLVLYASDDWFLLTLGMVAVVGIALAARNTVPKLYEQGKLLLNLGATREGERMNHNGLPWLVRRMNVYCELVNPALSGGVLRIPLRLVIPLTSRPVDEGEKWFPTARHDWILLPEGSPAEITHQSPEFVQLRFNGGATQVYRTLDFLALNARNLSNGFRLTSRLQVDFRHAPDVNGIAETLRLGVAEGLAAAEPQITPVSLISELSNIGTSGLDVLIQVDFAGEHASRYLELRREIQQLALACATMHGWIIPYQQLVLHQAGR